MGGLKAVIVAFVPGPVMIEGGWNALLYIDGRANTDQEVALTSIFSGASGGPWSRLAAFFTDGKYKGVKRANIEFVKEHRARRIKVSGVASLDIEAIRSMNPDEEVKLTNLRNVIHGNEHVLALSTHTVDAQGIRWEHVGKNGLYSNFRWSGP